MRKLTCDYQINIIDPSPVASLNKSASDIGCKASTTDHGDKDKCHAHKLILVRHEFFQQSVCHIAHFGIFGEISSYLQRTMSTMSKRPQLGR